MSLDTTGMIACNTILIPRPPHMHITCHRLRNVSSAVVIATVDTGKLYVRLCTEHGGRLVPVGAHWHVLRQHSHRFESDPCIITPAPAHTPVLLLLPVLRGTDTDILRSAVWISRGPTSRWRRPRGRAGWGRMDTRQQTSPSSPLCV